MKWTEVSSSNLALIGIDGHDLLVQFQRGDQYRYFGASMEYHRMVEQGMIGASVGKYFNANVRGNYEYERIVPV